MKHVDELLAMMFASLAIFLMLAIPRCAYPQEIPQPAYTDSQIVNAIFIAEGGYKATYLYGIRSVHYDNEADARQICLNTVRNNRRRYAEYGHKQYPTYLEFLASRYCPVEAHPLNKYWLKNVRYYLNKGA